MSESRLAPSAVPTKTRHLVVVWAVLCSIITYIDRVCIAQAKPLIVKDLGLTDKDWGWILSAFVWSYAAFEIPTGYLGDRFGARSTLTRVVVWWSAFTAFTAAAWNFWSLAIIRFLFGIGEAGCFPNITKAFTTWLPTRERVRAQGVNWMSARWGGAFTPLIVGLVLGFVDWKTAFVIFGVLGFVWAFGFYRWFRDDPKDHPGVNAAELQIIREGGTGDPGHGDMPWAKMLGSGRVWLLWLQYFCISYSWYFYITWLPSYMAEERHFDYRKDAWLNGMPLFLGGIGCFVGGLLLARLSKKFQSDTKARRFMGCLGAVVACFCLVASTWASDPLLALFLISLASFGNDLTMPAAWGAAMNIGGRYAGTLSGSMNMMGNFGGGFFPIAYPRIREGLSMEWVFYVSAGAYVISFLAWVFLDSSKPLETEEAHAATNANR